MTSAVEPMMRMVIVANEFASKGDGEPMYEDEETRQLAESAMCMLALHAREKRGAAPTAQSSVSVVFFVIFVCGHSIRRMRRPAACPDQTPGFVFGRCDNRAGAGRPGPSGITIFFF